MKPLPAMLRLILAGLLLVVATRLSGQTAPEERIIRLGVLTDNHPYSYRTAEGEMAGFSYELVKEIEQVMGLKFERVIGLTRPINQAFVEHRIDMLQSYAQLAEREATVDFSVPYLTMEGVIFVRKDEKNINSLADLRGRRVLVHRGSLGENLLRKAGLADSINYVDSVEKALEKVNQGEADATLATRLTGLAIAHYLKLTQIRPVEAVIPGYDVRYCIAVQEGDRELLARINEGLAVLVRTGRFDALYRKWFGHVAPTGYTAEQVMLAVAIGLALALIIAIWAGFKQRALRQRIAQQAEALRVSEERHRGIFEGAHDGLLVLGEAPEDGRIEQINPAAMRLLVLPGGPSTGASLGTLLAADVALLNRVRSAAAAGRIEEFEHERPDGGWLRVGVGPLGRRTLVTLTDIREQVHARRRLQQQEEQIRQKQKLEAVGTLAGGVAHDFNNLLTAIMGYTELSLLNLPPTHPETDGLQQVMRAARRARDLVKQILTFSRHAAPGRELVTLAPLVDETINLLQTLARNAVRFEVNLPANLPAIMADPAQVHQVLMNLGTNAVQAMRGAPGRLVFQAEAVTVGPEMQELHPGLRPGAYVRVGVQDNGPGMTPEVQQRVFEPFFTTKAPGEGSGLGLSVVHGIMQQHEGLVALYSHPGRGSLFHLYFPAAAATSRAAEESLPPVLPAGHGELILFVDDEPAIVEMGKRMLVRLGYRVNVHGGAQEAWAEFAAQPDAFAVVVSDLAMPGMNGLQLLGRVRSLRPNQAFVLTSGFFAEAEKNEAIGLGATELVPKPLSYAEIARAVAAALVRR